VVVIRINVVSSFRSLRSVVECHGCLNEELTAGVSQAAAILQKSVFSRPGLHCIEKNAETTAFKRFSL